MMGANLTGPTSDLELISSSFNHNKPKIGVLFCRPKMSQDVNPGKNRKFGVMGESSMTFILMKSPRSNED
jgi:hypothetical protein